MMKQHFVKIKSIDHITHDVLRIVTEKPLHYTFTSGQATEVSIKKKRLGRMKKDLLLLPACLKMIILSLQSKHIHRTIA